MKVAIPPATTEDVIPTAGPGAERAVVVAAALLVAGGWTAPALGISTALTGAAVTMGFIALVALTLRELRVHRQGRVVGRDTLDALRLGESRFKLLADHSADMIVDAGRDMVRRFVSPSSVPLLGYTPAELVGTAAADIVHPDDYPGYRRALEDLLQGTEERLITTQRYRRKDGRYIWTEANVQVTRDAATGEPSGYVGSLRDITARRDAETAVRDSEAFLRGVIDASPDCIKVLDLDGGVSFMSRNGLCLLEFDEPDELIGRDMALLWPDDAQATVHAAVSAAAAGAASRFRGHCSSAKGRPLHLDVVIAPIRGADGRPERLLALSRDVTASTEAETALQRVQERYRLLAENSSDMVMLLAPGPDGAALYVSPSSHRVLGYPPEVVADRYMPDLVHPDDRAAVRALLQALGPGDGIVLQTHRVRRSDGAFVWIEGAFQVAERGGEPTVVAALRDVTERQQRAEDLAAAKEVAERARRSAEQASEAKSDFLAAMSHEIRTPLNCIIGFTDLMLDAGDLPEQARRQADLIRSSGAALLTVVNDVLDFSKVEAGAVELEAIPFSPTGLARHCAAILRGYAGTKALDIAVEVGERIPACLLGDEARLRQVLLNLLNNAVKFTPRGRVTLRLSYLEAAGAGETIRFEVADSGIGISEAKQHRLFERFSQVDSSVARRFGGSGLGLAICKKMVELMGGTIGVSSREGEGSTFWFVVTLPRAEAPAPPALPPAIAGVARAGRILLVEDIDINQRLAVALLEGAGHAVEVVGDGALAVAAVADTAYDLVLMDVQMPGMDGVTATRAIRASAGPGSRVPIVAMTANVFPDQIKAFRDAGMDGHIGKPLNRAQLQAVVAFWAGRDRDVDVGTAPVPVNDGGEVATFDDAVHHELSAHLGPPRHDDVLARFAASLPQRFVGDGMGSDDARRWKADAHVVLSVAGMTGFVDLVRCCRALETALPGSDDFAAALAAVRQARDAAIGRIAGLRAGLAKPPVAAVDGAEHAA